MTAITGAAGAMAIPSASTLKFVTNGQDGPTIFGFRGPPSAVQFGSVKYTNRIMQQVVTVFEYNAVSDEFTFEVDESNGVGFGFTRLLVEDATGTYRTLNRAAAFSYSGFPLKGWIWASAGVLWTLATVGQTFRIYVQR